VCVQPPEQALAPQLELQSTAWHLAFRQGGQLGEHTGTRHLRGQTRPRHLGRHAGCLLHVPLHNKRALWEGEVLGGALLV